MDVIICSSSSNSLRKAIRRTAGDEVQTTYDIEYKNNANSILISTPPGALHCKRIFFIKWEPDIDEEILRQSFIHMISNVVQHVILHKFSSIAFPTIACGLSGSSVQTVVKTMVLEMKSQLYQEKITLDSEVHNTTQSTKYL